MKAPFHWLVRFFLIYSLILVFSFPNTAWGEQIPDVTEGFQAPDFTLEDLNGHNVRLSDYKGRPVLLLFMTTWISGCWKMIPHMKESYSLYKAKGLVLFNIDISESKKKAERFAEERSIPYPTLLDQEAGVSRTFGVFSVPVMILINGEGRIICWDCSTLDDLLKKQFKVKEK